MFLINLLRTFNIIIADKNIKTVNYRENIANSIDLY